MESEKVDKKKAKELFNELRGVFNDDIYYTGWQIKYHLDKTVKKLDDD